MVSRTAVTTADVGEVDFADYTMPRLIKKQACLRPEKPFLWFAGRKWSYGEADRQSDGLALGLQLAGIGHGSHVAVLMSNQPEMVWTLIALAKLGAVAVLVNVAAKGDMLRYFLEQSDARFLIVDDALEERALDALSTCDHLLTVICNGPTGSANQRLSALILDGAPMIEREPQFNDVQVMMYTSGTTGPSKGVLCTYAQNVAAGRDMCLAFGYSDHDVLYTCLPLFHANALRATMTAAVWSGATFALSAKFSARTFWQEIAASRATQFNALGAMISILLKQEPGPVERQHFVRLCCTAPSFSPPDTASIEERFGLRLTSIYGSTEIGCPLYGGPETPRLKWPTCGELLPSFELRVADDNGFEVPHGEVGEFLIRPREPSFGFTGYYKMADATIEATRNYWFHSGDRGWRDEDGYYYFVDRKKESIRRRGENVSSFEVESIISRLQFVSEVAVVPVPSPLGEDDIFAFAVRQPGRSGTEIDLIQHCQESMAYFMVPRYVMFIDELPKNSSEKVEKYKLRQLALDSLHECWDRERSGVALVR